jgi:hypothetical protein
VIKRISGILTLALLTIGSFLSPFVSIAQEDGRLYVPETGHWITNDFLATYQSVSDPQSIFGYPITDAFINPTTQHVVQYFQRALFELHPENPPELRVEIKRLGEYLYKKGEVLPMLSNSPACQYFPDTGHQVCYAFLEFFKDHGGIAQFGYPISDIEIQEGRLVQYFQRACFEWHPELTTGHRVVLANLGQRYFDIRHENPQRLRPGSTIRTILSLKVRAFPGNAVMAPKGTQSIFVILQDQNLQPISNATVVLTVRYPSGKEDRYLADPTDNNGIAMVRFPMNDQTPGTVEVTVRVSFDTFEQTTRTSFRIWW